MQVKTDCQGLTTLQDCFFLDQQEIACSDKITATRLPDRWLEHWQIAQHFQQYVDFVKKKTSLVVQNVNINKFWNCTSLHAHASFDQSIDSSKIPIIEL